MRFDAYAALSELRSQSGGRANRAKHANPSPPISTNSTFSTGGTAESPQSLPLPFSTFSTISTGQASQSENCALSPRIAAAARAAFADYRATDDPHDPRAWA